jgi:hypothetical protein
MPLEYKPRVRLDSWAPPVARGPRRSLWWLWSIFLYTVVVVVGYLVVTGRVSLDDSDGAATISPAAPMPPTPTALAPQPPDVSRFTDNAARALHLPPCEDFLEPVEGAQKGQPSSNLERAGYASLLDDGRFREVCRTRVRRRVELCLAVNRGVLVGVTVHTEPSDPTTDSCIVRELRSVRYPFESTLRMVSTTTHLTAHP